MTAEHASPKVLRLHHALARCRHGIEIRDVSAKAAGDGWLIWGHYACPECGWVALDVVVDAPQIVHVGGLQLPVLIT